MPSPPPSNGFSRRRAAIIIKSILSNSATSIRLLLGNRESEIGATHSHMSLAQSVDYIGRVYRDYMQQGQIPAVDIADARILEIGPGDNVGVALRFIVAGARQVVCLDKFRSRHNLDRQLEIYQALRAELSLEEQDRYDQAIRLSSHFQLNTDKVALISNCGIETADRRLDPFFDIIVSRAVLEEVFDLDRAFAVMNRLLRPGGCLIHKIDLSDYGLFSGKGFSALEFLTVAAPVYSLMARQSGIPNRRRINFYRNQMDRYGYTATYSITTIAGMDRELSTYVREIAPENLTPEVLHELQAIRPRLAAEFRVLPDKDLLCGGLFLVARKPAN